MIKKTSLIPGYIDKLKKSKKITQKDIAGKSTLSKDVLRKINEGDSVKLSTLEKLTKIEGVTSEDLPVANQDKKNYEIIDFVHHEHCHEDWYSSYFEKQEISLKERIPHKINGYDDFLRLIKFEPKKTFFRIDGPTEKLLKGNVKETIKGLGDLISSSKTFLKKHGLGQPSQNIHDCFSKLEEKNIAHKLLNDLSKHNLQISYFGWRSAVFRKDAYDSSDPPTHLYFFDLDFHLAVFFGEKNKNLKFKYNCNYHVLPRYDQYWEKLKKGELNETDVIIEGQQIYDWFKENRYTLIKEEVESAYNHQKEFFEEMKKKKITGKVNIISGYEIKTSDRKGDK